MVMVACGAAAGWVDTAEYGGRSCLSSWLPASWHGSSSKRASERIGGSGEQGGASGVDWNVDATSFGDGADPAGWFLAHSWGASQRACTPTAASVLSSTAWRVPSAGIPFSEPHPVPGTAASIAFWPERRANL